MASPNPAPARGKQLAQIALILPFIGTLWVPFFNTTTPAFDGIPFFYWYLLLWIIISAVITGTVYLVTR